MRRRSGASIPWVLYGVVPAVGCACGFAMLATPTALGGLWLGVGPLAAAAVSGGLARTAGRDGPRTFFIAFVIGSLMVGVAMIGLLAYALGELPEGFEES